METKITNAIELLSKFAADDNLIMEEAPEEVSSENVSPAAKNLLEYVARELNKLLKTRVRLLNAVEWSDVQKFSSETSAGLHDFCLAILWDHPNVKKFINRGGFLKATGESIGEVAENVAKQLERTKKEAPPQEMEEE